MQADFINERQKILLIAFFNSIFVVSLNSFKFEVKISLLDCLNSSGAKQNDNFDVIFRNIIEFQIKTREIIR